MKEFIQTLDKERIGKVVVFSTSALTERAFPQIQKKLQDRGIQVENRNFFCRGEFTVLHKGRPNRKDQDAVKKFTVEIIEGLH